MRYLLLLSIFIGSHAFSQTQDAELWTGAAIKADLSKKWGIKYETQTRFFKNFSTLKTYYNELSTDYEFFDEFDLGISYRYSRKNKLDFYEGESRFCIDASYDLKFKKLDLEFKTRGRYQVTFDRLQIVNNDYYPNITSYTRWRFDLVYKPDFLGRFEPYIGCEFFEQLEPQQHQGIEAYRLFAGVELDLPARHELEFRYLFETEYRIQPERVHSYIIQYSYDLPSRLFKKKKKKK